MTTTTSTRTAYRIFVRGPGEGRFRPGRFTYATAETLEKARENLAKVREEEQRSPHGYQFRLRSQEVTTTRTTTPWKEIA
jgi:hypothetical protein